MTFILSLGFQDLVDDQGQKYGLLALVCAFDLHSRQVWFTAERHCNCKQQTASHLPYGRVKEA